MIVSFLLIFKLFQNAEFAALENIALSEARKLCLEGGHGWLLYSYTVQEGLNSGAEDP